MKEIFESLQENSAEITPGKWSKYTGTMRLTYEINDEAPVTVNQKDAQFDISFDKTGKGPNEGLFLILVSLPPGKGIGFLVFGALTKGNTMDFNASTSIIAIASLPDGSGLHWYGGFNPFGKGTWAKNASITMNFTALDPTKEVRGIIHAQNLTDPFTPSQRPMSIKFSVIDLKFVSSVPAD